jgi:hypothetical protein
MVSPFLQNSSASFSLTATPLLATIIAHATAIAAATKGNEKPDMIEKMQPLLCQQPARF